VPADCGTVSASRIAPLSFLSAPPHQRPVRPEAFVHEIDAGFAG
jgi:hypothetical protein